MPRLGCQGVEREFTFSGGRTMRMPRVRFTIRRMMVAVAVVAIVFGWFSWMGGRAARFRSLWAEHINKVGVVSSPKPRPDEVQGTYHLKMGEKYRIAALRPWLPVEADPPEPCHQVRDTPTGDK
jgi:hypothetical protein